MKRMKVGRYPSVRHDHDARMMEDDVEKEWMMTMMMNSTRSWRCGADERFSLLPRGSRTVASHSPPLPSTNHRSNHDNASPCCCIASSSLFWTPPLFVIVSQSHFVPSLLDVRLPPSPAPTTVRSVGRMDNTEVCRWCDDQRRPLVSQRWIDCTMDDRWATYQLQWEDRQRRGCDEVERTNEEGEKERRGEKKRME